MPLDRLCAGLATATRLDSSEKHSLAARSTPCPQSTALARVMTVALATLSMAVVTSLPAEAHPEACDQNGRPWRAEPMQSSKGTERLKFARVA